MEPASTKLIIGTLIAAFVAAYAYFYGEEVPPVCLSPDSVQDAVDAPVRLAPDATGSVAVDTSEEVTQVNLDARDE